MSDGRTTPQKRELMSDEIDLLQKNPLLPQEGQVIDYHTHGGLGLHEAAAADVTSGTTFLRFDFALVAVKTIAWSGSDGDQASSEAKC